MTNEQTSTLVLKDQAGEYYLLPQATLERGRVPTEHLAEVERLLAEQQDVHGHAIALPLLVVLGVVGVGMAVGAALWGGIEQAALPTPPPLETPPINVGTRWPVR